MLAKPGTQPAEKNLSPLAQNSYDLWASANGNCIHFAVKNTGTEDLALDPRDFAIIPRGTRQVVSYDPAIDSIDMPPAVAPGQTVFGRAMFGDLPAPRDNRLVFKPANCGVGTFAVIEEAQAKQPARPGPGNTPVLQSN